MAISGRRINLSQLEQNKNPLVSLVSGENDTSIAVVFSHVNIPEGKFGQYRAAEALKMDRLYLNTRDNDWFTNGISPFSGDISETLDFVTEVADGRKIIVIGHSMGAYLSLLLGNLVPNSKFIATSPEINLGVQFSRSYANNVFHTAPFANLLDFEARFHGNPEGVILFGAYDPIDCYFLSRYDEYAHLGEFREVSHHHGVTEYLSSMNQYRTLLTQQKSALPRFDALEITSPVFTYGTKEQYQTFYDTYRDYRSKDYKRATELCDSMAEWLNPGWQDLRGKVYERVGFKGQCLHAAELAYQAQPNLLNHVERYVVVCTKLKEGQRCKRALDGIRQSDVNHPLVKRMRDFAENAFGTKNYYTNLKPLPLNKPKTREHTFRSVAPSVSDIRELFTWLDAGKHDEVGQATYQILQNDPAIHPDILAARALALLNKADHATSRRTILEVLEAKILTHRVGLVLSKIAITTQDVWLVELYLDTPKFDAKIRKSLVDMLRHTIRFTTDPIVLAKLAREMELYHENPREVLEQISNQAKANNGLEEYSKRFQANMSID